MGGRVVVVGGRVVVVGGRVVATARVVGVAGVVGVAVGGVGAGGEGGAAVGGAVGAVVVGAVLGSPVPGAVPSSGASVSSEPSVSSGFETVGSSASSTVVVGAGRGSVGATVGSVSAAGSSSPGGAASGVGAAPTPAASTDGAPPTVTVGRASERNGSIRRSTAAPRSPQPVTVSVPSRPTLRRGAAPCSAGGPSSSRGSCQASRARASTDTTPPTRTPGRRAANAATGCRPAVRVRCDRSCCCSVGPSAVMAVPRVVRCPGVAPGRRAGRPTWRTVPWAHASTTRPPVGRALARSRP